MNWGGIPRYDVYGWVNGERVVLSPLQLPLTLSGKGKRECLKKEVPIEIITRGKARATENIYKWVSV